MEGGMGERALMRFLQEEVKDTQTQCWRVFFTEEIPSFFRPSVHLSSVSFTFDWAVYAQGRLECRVYVCGSKQHPTHCKPTHNAGSSKIITLPLPEYWCNLPVWVLCSLFLCCYLLWYLFKFFSSSSIPHWDFFLSSPSSPHHFPNLKLTEPPKAIRSDCLIVKHRVHRLKWKIWISLGLHFDSHSAFLYLPLFLVPPRFHGVSHLLWPQSRAHTLYGYLWPFPIHLH